MEIVKRNLEHDYNLAVDAYVNKDYILFFRNIRPAIELLSKLLIHDFVQDEELAKKIINGKAYFWKDKDFEKYVIINKPKKIQGGAYAATLPNVFYYKHPDIAFSKLDDKKIRLRKGIEGNAAYLYQMYSTASELGSHTGESSLNDRIQAMACSIFFLGFFDFLRSNHLIQTSTIEFLDKLHKYDTNGESEELQKIKKQIIEANKKIEELKIALAESKQRQYEAEKGNKDLESQMIEIKKNLRERQDEVKKLQDLLTQKLDSGDTPELLPPSDSKSGKDLLALLTEPISDWDVEEEAMDEEQLDIINDTVDSSILVAGCAGSGKSVIAMHKAEQLSTLGEEVILIAYTISLSNFMNVGKRVGPYRFYYYNQWKSQGMPKADYIIVDEIQDFTREEICEFMVAANKHIMFFGDTAQSIYKQYGKQTLSIEEISELTKLDILMLYNNYRLPRSVAKITQDYVGVNVDLYKDKVYQNKEKTIPYICFKKSIAEQVDSICNIFKENKGLSIGVLLPSNENVVTICNDLKLRNVSFEEKYSVTTATGKQFVDKLDFTTITPKLMTYHSAKGLQFDIVILPMYNGAADTESRKALYVAMTRTMHKLYIFYSTPKLAYPLSDVPTFLYHNKE